MISIEYSVSSARIITQPVPNFIGKLLLNTGFKSGFMFNNHYICTVNLTIMKKQKIVIRKVNNPLSFDKNKFEEEAKIILKTVVIPQVKKAENTLGFDKKRCLSPSL